MGTSEGCVGTAPQGSQHLRGAGRARSPSRDGRTLNEGRFQDARGLSFGRKGPGQLDNPGDEDTAPEKKMGSTGGPSKRLEQKCGSRFGDLPLHPLPETSLYRSLSQRLEKLNMSFLRPLIIKGGPGTQSWPVRHKWASARSFWERPFFDPCQRNDCCLPLPPVWIVMQ